VYELLCVCNRASRMISYLGQDRNSRLNYYIRVSYFGIPQESRRTSTMNSSIAYHKIKKKITLENGLRLPSLTEPLCICIIYDTLTHNMFESQNH